MEYIDIFEDEEVSEVKYIYFEELEKMVENKAKGLLIHEEEYEKLFNYIRNKEELNKIKNKLRECYSIETAYPKDRERWNINNPTCGQCAITALIVQENFGGTIHKININENETHYFNIINGEIVDFTREQFDVNGIKIKYKSNEFVSREKILSNSNTNERYNILKQKLNYK